MTGLCAGGWGRWGAVELLLQQRELEEETTAETTEGFLTSDLISNKNVSEPSHILHEKLQSESFSPAQSLTGPISFLSGGRGGPTARVYLEQEAAASL